jgi:hypothetical protein
MVLSARIFLIASPESGVPGMLLPASTLVHAKCNKGINPREHIFVCITYFTPVNTGDFISGLFHN